MAHIDINVVDARRPNPKRSLFSSLKFCSICIRQLHNFRHLLWTSAPEKWVLDYTAKPKYYA